jgi:hypothetical protein
VFIFSTLIEVFNSPARWGGGKTGKKTPQMATVSREQ